jgi:drug/metabolite transporter (DMT)-like permease
MKSLALCSSGVAITLINTAPVMFLPFAVFLYKEKISPRAAIGAVVSVAGVALLML